MGALKSAVKGVTKLVGIDPDAIANASKLQAKATEDSARRTDIANKEAARASQQTQETQINQSKAADAAAELLNQPVAQADVAARPAEDAVDPVSGQRRKPRDAYSNSSINI